jgi:arylsulfatase A-like enzyme
MPANFSARADLHVTVRAMKLGVAVALVELVACTFGTTAPDAEAPEAARTVDVPAMPAEARASATPVQTLSDSVVLVTIDTMRADALSAHGGPAPTPVLDALASGGWDFTDCISASMLTNPAHASIMTSLYSRDHGVYDNESGIRAATPTLARALAKHGLRTIAVIGFPHLDPEVSGLGSGFETVIRAERQERRAEATTRAALAATHAVAPHRSFFLWVHYTDAHAPYEPPAGIVVPEITAATPMAAAAKAAPGFQRRHPWFRGIFEHERFVEPIAARYYGEVSAVDRALGDLISGLQSAGRLERTAIVITSDHGENLGEHRLFFHHGGLYRQTVQVPLIIRTPAGRPATITDLVETVDIAPTILALVGAPQWTPMRGTSLIDADGIPSAEPRRGRPAFSEHMGGTLAAVRTDSMTLLYHRKSSRQFPSYPSVAGRRELYDRREDPDELSPRPLVESETRELEAHLQRLLTGASESPPTPPRAASGDRESLRALGYID